jgi:hypothetical protein
MEQVVSRSIANLQLKILDLQWHAVELCLLSVARRFTPTPIQVEGEIE